MLSISKIREMDGHVSRAVVVLSAVLLVTSCGRVLKTSDQDDDGQINESSISNVERDRKGAREIASALALANSDQESGTFENAKKVPIKDDKHPWDGRASGARRDETTLVPNGDSKPPQMASPTISSCAELQPNRCVSCCEDDFAFGSENWEQCVAYCPQLGLEQLPTEY